MVTPWRSLLCVYGHAAAAVFRSLLSMAASQPVLSQCKNCKAVALVNFKHALAALEKPDDDTLENNLGHWAYFNLGRRGGPARGLLPNTPVPFS